MKFKILLSACFMLCSLMLNAQQLAFPTAEGFGRFTTGGRGGAVYEVTNLNDAGPGSLRDACSKAGARTIVFRVSGTIALLSELKITSGDLTIAGQTAPGDGICIKDYKVTINANNIIVRYIKFRVGNAYKENEPDAFGGTNRQNLIIDHCSMSWSVDETGSFYDNENFTMQWCILSESLYNSGHAKGAHGYGGIQGGWGASFHHNLYADHTSRNPRFCGARYHLSTASKEIVDFRNNVIFNWGYQTVYGGESGQQNMVNNYFKSGPATNSSKKNRIVEIDDSNVAGYTPGQWYIEGNYMNGYPAISADNWAGGVQGVDSKVAGVRATSPFTFASVTTETAEDAYISVLAKAGANFPKADTVDKRIISEVKSGICAFGGSYYNGSSTIKTGIIDSAANVGGWPILNSLPAPVDTDKDGMPDDWEAARGLNPNDAADRNALISGYTVLEKYINGLVDDTIPVKTYNLTISKTGTGTVTIDPPTGPYLEGSVVTLTASEDTVNILKDWSGDAAGTDNTINITMSGDKSVTANFQATAGLSFTLNTAVTGSGAIVLNPPGGSYVSGTTVQVIAVPDSGSVFISWSGNLAGTSDTTSITLYNNRSIAAKFQLSGAKKVAYVTDSLGATYVNDIKILPALKADPNFVVTEINGTKTGIDYSPYDLVIFSEVPASNAAGITALKGINKPLLMMKVHSYKTSIGSWNWTTSTTAYNQNATETNIVTYNKMHPIFKGVTFVNNNEVQVISSVVSSKGLTYIVPSAFVTSGGEISTVAEIKNNPDQSSIIQIAPGTTIGGTLVPKRFVQVGINSVSFANVTDDGVKIVLNTCYYLLDTGAWVGLNTLTSSQVSFNCYPVPVSNTAKLVVNLTEQGKANVTVCDLAGRIVTTLPATMLYAGANELSLDMGHLSPGIYFCTLQFNGTTVTRKLLKE